MKFIQPQKEIPDSPKNGSGEEESAESLQLSE